MSVTRVMSGLIDQTGREVNGLEIAGMISRNPRPRYRIICKVCGAHSTADHDRITNGTVRCLAAGCGKSDRSKHVRTGLAERASRLADEAVQARADASIRRMDAETEDYVLPAKRPSAELTAAGPMRERDRLSIREHLQEVAAQERAEREAREAPVRAAEAALKDTASKLASLEREAIGHGKDDAFVIDPETFKPIPKADVDAWHRAESAKFRAANPDYFACDENFAAITAYVERNAPGIQLVSSAQLEAAYKRLSAYGLLRDRPTAAPKQASAPARPKPPAPTEPAFVEGWDLISGESRKWTPRELDRLSSTDYRKALRLFKADLELPNVGPGSGRVKD